MDGDGIPAWQWDEGKPVNRDFTSAAEVEKYDAFHDRFRDVAAELERLDGWFRPGAGVRLGEFGCGTGRFTCRMAAKGASVTVVDLSEAMLRQTARAAAERGLENVECRVGTFLTYRHEGRPLDGWRVSRRLKTGPGRGGCVSPAAQSWLPGGPGRPTMWRVRWWKSSAAA